YFDACGLRDGLVVGCPTLVICGTRTGLRLAPNPAVRPVVLHKSDTRRFRCGLVGLKGEIAGRLLARLADDPDLLTRLDSARIVEELASQPVPYSTRALA